MAPTERIAKKINKPITRNIVGSIFHPPFKNIIRKMLKSIKVLSPKNIQISRSVNDIMLRAGGESVSLWFALQNY